MLCCVFGLCVIVIVIVCLQFVVTKVVEEEEVGFFFFLSLLGSAKRQCKILGDTNVEIGAPHNKRTAQSILKEVGDL